MTTRPGSQSQEKATLGRLVHYRNNPNESWRVAIVAEANFEEVCLYVISPPMPEMEVVYVANTPITLGTEHAGWIWPPR